MKKALNAVVWSIALVTLSGCFFSQEAPQNQISEQSVILGHVRLTDMTISNQGAIATIEAQFAKHTEKKTEPISIAKPTIFNLDEAAPAMLPVSLTQQTRGPSCETKRLSRSEESRAEDMALSVGNLYFGPALQNNLMRLDKNSKNIYQAILTPGLPAGAYEVITPDGEEGVPPFSDILTLPEQLEWIRVNGIDFGEPNMEYRKHDKLEVMWREPRFANSQNLMLIQFVGRTDDEALVMTCGALEADIMATKEMKTWSIDASYLRDIPSTASVSIQITRAHELTPQRQNTRLILQGLRTFYSKMDYIEN